MRRLSCCLGILFLASCASGGEAPRGERASAEPTRSQLEALERLQSDSGGAWALTFDAARGAPSHLAGRSMPLLQAGQSHAEASLRFLAAYREIFGITNADAELRVTRSRADALAMHHVRMEQHVGGVRVAGGEITTHFSADGAMTAVSSNYVPGLSGVDLNPSIDAERAVAIAEARLAAKDAHFHPGQFWKAPARELLIFAGGGQGRLAYQVSLYVMSIHPSNLVTYVDAHTGEVILSYDDLKTAAATGTGVDSDGATRTLQIDATGSTYSLVDTTRTPGKISTFTYKNTPTSACVNDQAADGCLDQFFQTHPTGELVTSTSQGAWDTANPGKGAAVEAHVYAGLVYDYYKQQHQRESIDGKGLPINSNVHFSTSFGNAFWNGEGMFYGDGDGITLKLLTKGFDVIAHELTHGVTQYESSLEYLNQSGALNEAMSDIFGAFAEHEFYPDPKKNWLIGEKVSGVLLNGPLRDMAHPGSVLQKQPDNMKGYDETSSTAQQDNGGVHLNSGIVNNAVYLMTIGGKNDTSGITVSSPIGWEKAKKIWYRTNTEYLMTKSNFLQAAQATLSSATDLGLTDADRGTIECAWIATGVITTPSACRSVIGADAGVTDAGSDAATTTNDGGADAAGDASATDAGTGERDAGAAVDAAGPRPDAGSTGNDAGTGAQDAGDGTGTGSDSGCGCRVAGPTPGGSAAGVSLLAGLAVLARARRRRAR